ncbi:hypothetical protein D1B17_03775 [Companilactobacillus zhachilii]|uniref:Uncharacterized protein n=1 Tax=Companilactobacillus zhachilii TaxID=2304606 RepID=A0A386PTV0_9LACO|nr:hypothetical protein [Companilactobacillus zhachilii]AYE37797.1 hypothetical protein D1B17_03775 [Companilactobacillus zhachilii]
MKKDTNYYIDPVIIGLKFIIDEMSKRKHPSSSDLEILEVAQTDLVTLQRAQSLNRDVTNIPIYNHIKAVLE